MTCAISSLVHENTFVSSEINWATENLPAIEASMKRLADQRYSEAYLDESEGDLSIFDPQKRLLSEMEICDFLINDNEGRKLGVDLPKYVLQTTGAKVLTPANSQPVPHMYLKNADNIICFTPGQFIKPFDTKLLKGARMQILIERAKKAEATKLITQLSDEVYMLNGNRYDIARVLKILYE